MISYNHYASGAVGDFLYRRVAGIEATEPGYKSFQVRPVLGGSLTWAKSHVLTPYGRIRSSWKVEQGTFTVEVQVPMGTVCQLTMPNGETITLHSGSHVHSCPV
jgi:alpha-L-rhamnosidase